VEEEGREIAGSGQRTKESGCRSMKQIRLGRVGKKAPGEKKANKTRGGFHPREKGGSKKPGAVGDVKQKDIPGNCPPGKKESLSAKR